MKKTMFSLLLCIVLLALLAGPVFANGAVRIPYTGQENTGYCFTPPVTDPRCALFSGGDTQILPNGKMISRNVVMVFEFQSDNPLFDGVTIATFNVYPGSATHYPVIGTWYMELYAYDGYWEGPVSISMSASGGTHSVYSGKGYGALDGMIIQGTNDNGFLSGKITELPGYQP